MFDKIFQRIEKETDFLSEAKELGLVNILLAGFVNKELHKYQKEKGVKIRTKKLFDFVYEALYDSASRTIHFLQDCLDKKKISCS